MDGKTKKVSTFSILIISLFILLLVSPWQHEIVFTFAFIGEIESSQLSWIDGEGHSRALKVLMPGTRCASHLCPRLSCISHVSGHTRPASVITHFWGGDASMAPSVLQDGGFLLAVIGAAALIAATAASTWSVRDRPVDEEASLYRHQGLWRDCATTFSGSTQCGSLPDTQGSSGRRTRFTNGQLTSKSDLSPWRTVFLLLKEPVVELWWWKPRQNEMRRALFQLGVILIT